MKKLIFLIAGLGLAIHARAEVDTKNALVSELVKIEGIDEIVRDAKSAAKKQADEMTEKMFAQIATSMPTLEKEYWEAIRAAADRMVGKLDGSWDVNKAVAVWSDIYAKEFSETELQQMIAEAKTPFGQRQIAAGKRASMALRAFIMERGKAAADAGLKEYVQELQQIVAKATAVQPGSTNGK